jgi:peptidoglycan/LPS O-acetylase OafA/YrhL
VTVTEVEGATSQGWKNPACWSNNNCDFLRFFLATLVIFSHSFALLSGTDNTEPLMILTRQLPSGALAVDGFFILSGLLVTHSLMRSRGALDYLRKRAKRIYPGFTVAVLLCAFVVGPLAARDPHIPFQPGQIAATVRAVVTLMGDFQRYAFLDNPFKHSANGSLWSISYEAWCYVGVMLLGLTGWLNRRTVLGIFIVSVAASVVFEVWNLDPHAGRLELAFGSPASWARLLPFYLSGVTFYLYRESLPFSGVLAALSAAGLVVGTVVPHGLAAALPTFGAYLLFWLAFHPRIPFHRWARRGDFSYGIYLYAFPIQQLIVKFWLPHLRPLILFAISAPLAIGAGVASWHLVEKRFLRQREARRREASWAPTRDEEAPGLARPPSFDPILAQPRTDK